MARSFFDGTDEQFLTGSQHFADLIDAAPEAYGLTAAEAAAYRALSEAYAAAFMAARNPETRTRGMVARKNAAKQAARTEASRLAAIIRGRAQTTKADLISLGLAELGRRRRRTPAPSEQPRVRVLSVEGRLVTVRVSNAPGAARSKPAGAVGAAVLVWAGKGEPPTGRHGWTSWATTTRRTARVRLPERPTPGTQVWVTAAWLNRRLQAGPLGRPASGYAQFGEAVQPMSLGLAA